MVNPPIIVNPKHRLEIPIKVKNQIQTIFPSSEVMEMTPVERFKELRSKNDKLQQLVKEFDLNLEI